MNPLAKLRAYITAVRKERDRLNTDFDADPALAVPAKPASGLVATRCDQGERLSREELVDELDEAITDTIDMDWSPSWGARACVERLEKLGLFPVAAPAEDWWKPDPEDPYWMLEIRQGFEGAGSWCKNLETCLTTRDPAKALRFPSRWSASVAQKRLYPLDGRFEPTEHLWIKPAIVDGSPQGRDGEARLDAKHDSDGAEGNRS